MKVTTFTILLGAVLLSSCATRPAPVVTVPPAAQRPAQPPAPSAATPSANTPFEPTVGQAGKDVVWVPTSAALVETMLDLAKLTPADYVIDLGSGDGRNIIAAAKRGASGHGVEFNPEMVTLADRLAREAGVSTRARFIQGDMYEADISKATVMALFLLPTNLDKLVDRFLALPAGTRIVMNTFTVTGWDPDESVKLETNCVSWCTALLYVVPAKVAGAWRIDEREDITLTQEFQMLKGTVAPGSSETSTISGRLRGAEISMTIGASTYKGRVEGGRMTGTVTIASTGATRPFSGTRLR